MDDSRGPTGTTTSVSASVVDVAINSPVNKNLRRRTIDLAQRNNGSLVKRSTLKISVEVNILYLTAFR